MQTRVVYLTPEGVERFVTENDEVSIQAPASAFHVRITAIS